MEEEIRQLQELVRDLSERLTEIERSQTAQINAYLPKGANFILSQVETEVKGSQEFYVSDSSGGAVNRKLTFKDGVLIKKT